jgi:hypothetical protein
MVEGIQIKKISIERQADSIFGDEDLIRLGDEDLASMVDQYFGEDSDRAMKHLLKRRSVLLEPEDVRKYQREYQKTRKEREYRMPIRFNYERDRDILDWLAGLENKSDAIKDAIRYRMRHKK